MNATTYFGLRMTAAAIFTAGLTAPFAAHAVYPDPYEEMYYEHENDAELESEVSDDSVAQFTTRHANAILNMALTSLGGTPINTAGGPLDAFTNVALHTDISYGYENDALVYGNATDWNGTVFLTGDLGEKWSVGLGIGYDRYETDAPLNLDQESFTFDAFALYHVNENLSLGGFVNDTYSDLDDSSFTVNGLSGTVGGSTNRIGAGLLANYQIEYQGFTLNATTALASMNKSNIGDLFSNDHTSWVNMLSAHRQVTEQLGVETFVSFNHMFDAPANDFRDKDYGTIGVEASYAFSESVSIRGGYERSVFYENFEDHRVNLGLTYSW